MKFNEIKGNLVTLALNGEFEVITHGCNCFCTMGAGIAPQMAKNFRAADHIFKLERLETKGDYNKLGCIEGKSINIGLGKTVEMVNSYTQYGFGVNHSDGTNKPIDYDALALCFKKINFNYKGLHIGLPLIGCGLAGGDWAIVKELMINHLKDMDVTVVHFG